MSFPAFIEQPPEFCVIPCPVEDLLITEVEWIGWPVPISVPAPFRFWSIKNLLVEFLEVRLPVFERFWSALEVVPRHTEEPATVIHLGLTFAVPSFRQLAKYNDVHSFAGWRDFRVRVEGVDDFECP